MLAKADIIILGLHPQPLRQSRQGFSRSSWSRLCFKSRPCSVLSAFLLQAFCISLPAIFCPLPSAGACRVTRKPRFPPEGSPQFSCMTRRLTPGSSEAYLKGKRFEWNGILLEITYENRWDAVEQKTGLRLTVDMRLRCQTSRKTGCTPSSPCKTHRFCNARTKMVDRNGSPLSVLSRYFRFSSVIKGNRLAHPSFPCIACAGLYALT